METFTWRFRAKVIATIDTVFQWINILFAIFLAFVMIGGHDVTKNWRSGLGPLEYFNIGGMFDSEELSIGIRILMALVFSLTATIFIGFQLWAASKLLDAAEIATAPTDALAKSRIWRNVTIPFLLLGIVFRLVEMNIPDLIIFISWRGIALYVVYKFSQELASFTVYPQNR